MVACVCCRLAIGDLGTQYFADRGIFCAGRVADEDLQRVAKATGELMACRQTGRQACPLLLEVTDRAECRHVGRHDVHGDALLSSFSCHSRLCGAEVAMAAVPATYRGGVSFCAAGARVQTTVSNLDKAVLGTCGRFEERQVGRSIEILHRQCLCWLDVSRCMHESAE